jgi:hypothetical protein
VRVGSTSFPDSTVHVRGILRLQTACASGEERAETSFDVALASKDGGAQTTEAAVTLTPKASKDCSMRVEIVSDGGDQLLLERASLVDTLLNDPSFESGAPQWKLTKGTDGATFTTQPAQDSSDGGAVGVLKAGASPVSIIQDLPLDLSSEAVLGTFTIDARSTAATPVDIAVFGLRLACNNNEFLAPKASCHQIPKTSSAPSVQHASSVLKLPSSPPVPRYNSTAPYLICARIMSRRVALATKHSSRTSSKPKPKRLNNWPKTKPSAKPSSPQPAAILNV